MRATAAERLDRAGTSTPPGQAARSNTRTESDLFGNKRWLDLTTVVAANVRSRGVGDNELASDITGDVITDVMRTWTSSKQISADTTKNWKLAVQRALQRVPRYMEKHLTWRQELGVDEATAEALLYQGERSDVVFGDGAEYDDATGSDGAPWDLFDPEGNTVTREEYYQQTATPPRRRKRVS